MTNYNGSLSLRLNGRDSQGDTFTATAALGIVLTNVSLSGTGAITGSESVTGNVTVNVHYAAGGSNGYTIALPTFSDQMVTSLSNFNILLGPIGREFGISLFQLNTFDATRSNIALSDTGTFDVISAGYHLSGTVSASGSMTAATSIFGTPSQSVTKWKSATATTPFAFAVTRVGNTAVSGSMPWSVVGSGTNPAQASDFASGSLPSGTVAFAPGQSTQTVTVNLPAGSLLVQDRTFSLSVPAAASGELLIGAPSGSAAGAIRSPLDTVVALTVQLPGVGTIKGSGVLIFPDEVLTAAHLVYNSDAGGAVGGPSSILGTATTITAVPAATIGTAQPFGSASGTVTFINRNFSDPGMTVTPGKVQYDLALIHLSKGFEGLGAMILGSNFAGGTANVTGYPATSATIVSNPETLSADALNAVLTGTGLGSGSSGGPVWTAGPDGSPTVVGVISSENTTLTGYFSQLTTASLSQMKTQLGADQGLAIRDTTSGAAVADAPTQYVGPVNGLQRQYINITSHSLNINVSTPNWFLHSGDGTDALAASGGTNVLDGGTGSNFLTGGGGTDTFFVDDRGAAADIWSTVNNFHVGDAATIWGITQQGFGIAWVDNQGAVGFQGLTLHATAAGKPIASLTLPGFSLADLSNGRLSTIFGTDPGSGSPYLYVKDNT